MIVLGLILIIVAAVAVLFAVIATGTLTASPLSAVGITVSVTPLTMFVAGAVALLLVVLGLALISRGTKRSVHTRRELRHLRKERANQPAAAGAAAGGTTRTDTGDRGGRPAGDRGHDDRSTGLGEERRGAADVHGNQTRGNEYPPAPR
jgi:hypothetical protein